MRTRRTGDEISQLPPPPAPTARDANPWQVTGAPQPPQRMPSIRAPRGRDPSTRPARDALRNLFALGIVAFIVISGLVEALQGGGVGALIGMVFPLVILAVFFLGRWRKAKRRDRAGSAAGPAAGPEGG